MHRASSVGHSRAHASTRVAAKTFRNLSTYFLRWCLLAVTPLAATAGADPPPRLLDGSGSAASPRKSETLLQARAMHHVSVRVSDLHWAALEDDVVDVKRLIAAGASREARDAAGDTPLREALRPDHSAALREAVRIEHSGAGTRSRCRGTNRRGRVSLENTSM